MRLLTLIIFITEHYILSSCSSLTNSNDNNNNNNNNILLKKLLSINQASILSYKDSTKKYNFNGKFDSIDFEKNEVSNIEDDDNKQKFEYLPQTSSPKPSLNNFYKTSYYSDNNYNYNPLYSTNYSLIPKMVLKVLGAFIILIIILLGLSLVYKWRANRYRTITQSNHTFLPNITHGGNLRVHALIDRNNHTYYYYEGMSNLPEYQINRRNDGVDNIYKPTSQTNNTYPYNPNDEAPPSYSSLNLNQTNTNISR